MKQNLKTSTINLLIITALWIFISSCSQPKLSPDQSVLSKPFLDEKIVIAHYMTEIIPGRNVFWYQDSLYDPNGKSSHLGGVFQYKPLLGTVEPGKTTEEYLLDELKQAKALGIDGFSFCWHYSSGKSSQENHAGIIKTFLQLARENNIPFKFNLCLTLPHADVSEKEKVETWGYYIKDVLAETKDTPYWLKTPDGRFIFHLWAGDMMSDEVRSNDDLSKPDAFKYIAQAYEDLARYVGVDIAYIWHIRPFYDTDMVKRVLEYFPAIWLFDNTNDERATELRELCKAGNRFFSETVRPDFYCSKVYRMDDHNYRTFHSWDALKDYTVDQLKRRYISERLSLNYRQTLEKVIDENAKMITYVTYNDFPEGHHIAPEINHNFGFSLLLRYYKTIWKNEAWNEPELAIAFYKKYPQDAKVEPYDYFTIGKSSHEPDPPEPYDDLIEVATILNGEGVVWVNGKPRGKVDPGLQVTTMPIEIGPVHIQVRRGDSVIIDFTPPECITDKPYRTDRFTFAYSSEFEKIYRELYGNEARIIVSQEYCNR